MSRWALDRSAHPNGRALPRCTCIQVARQQGSYLASLFDRQLVVKEAPAEPEQLPVVKLAKEAYPFV